MNFTALASGSKGNAYLVTGPTGSILVDCGASLTYMEKALEGLSVKASEVRGIIVTHEHYDHVKGVGYFSKRYGTPVFATERTFKNFSTAAKRGVDKVEFINQYRPFSLGGIEFELFETCHDAADPSGFTAREGDRMFGFATDLGSFNSRHIDLLRQCQAVVIESNHDTAMLENGPYPPHLKKRIKSSRGHLSNDQTLDLLGKSVTDDLHTVMLAHLSETNNTPQMAYLTATRNADLFSEGRRLLVARQWQVGSVVEV
jgi:phosphoribosyl 1,2-cyclic phosphodiesterase